jgi:hypothetical protein
LPAIITGGTSPRWRLKKACQPNHQRPSFTVSPWTVRAYKVIAALLAPLTVEKERFAMMIGMIAAALAKTG